jgi:hypothetical protein
MWTPPPPPGNERQRLSDLQGYKILDTANEERFDRITRLAARMYDADVSFLSFIDAGQQWMKSKTSDALHVYVARDASVCTLVVSSGEARVFEDLRAAPELVGHPLATEMPWRFYASVPVMGGSDTVIGTLCVMRTEPGAPPGFNLEALNDLAAVTAHELELTLQHSRLTEASKRDSLTGLFNRRMLDEELPRAVRRAMRLSAPVTLLLIDLDHFKELNDRLGHAAGDTILSDFARFLSAFWNSGCRRGSGRALYHCESPRGRVAPSGARAADREHRRCRICGSRRPLHMARARRSGALWGQGAGTGDGELRLIPLGRDQFGRIPARPPGITGD